MVKNHNSIDLISPKRIRFLLMVELFSREDFILQEMAEITPIH